MADRPPLKLVGVSPVSTDRPPLKLVGGFSPAPQDPGFQGVGAYGKKALQAIGDAADYLETKTAAPLRAGVGKGIEGKYSEMLPAMAEQLKSNTDLPTTPTGEQLVSGGMTKAGIHPEFVAPTAKIVGPAVQAGLDVLNLPVGPELAVGPMKAALKAGEAVGDLGIKGAFKLGEGLTQGNLNVAKSLRATETLSPLQQMFPTLSGKVHSTKKVLSDIRGLADALPETVPGSGSRLQGVVDNLEKAKGDVLAAPNVQPMIDMINKKRGVLGDMIGPPKDLTAGDLDKLLSNIDSVSYTDKGSSRAVKSLLKPALGDTRKEITGLLETTPQGQSLLGARAQSEAAATARHNRGALAELSSWGTTLAGATMGHPGAIAARAIAPTTYHEAVGAARIPGYYAGKALENFPKTSEFIGRAEALKALQSANDPTQPNYSPWMKGQ